MTTFTTTKRFEGDSGVGGFLVDVWHSHHITNHTVGHVGGAWQGS